MALTASKNLMEKYDPTATREDFLATDSTQYFKGGLVGLTAGKVVKITNATTVSSVWVCEDEVLTGVSTTVRIGVRSGTFKFLNGDSIADPGDVGKRAFAGAAGDDSAFKAGDPITEACLGVIEGVDGATAPGGAGVWVKVPGFREIIKPLSATTGDNLSGS
jgi:hypothetical protein